MIAVLTAALHLGVAVVHGAISAVEAIGMVGPGTGTHPVLLILLVGVLGVVAATVAAALVALPVDPDPGAPVHRGQTVDRSRLLGQSDPDAPGRTRPRAPARGLAAA